MSPTTPGAANAIACIAASGGIRIDPPTLLPARLVTELSGEAVRARLCAFSDETGAEWCLRPDMTTPIADLVARGDVAETRYHYAGPVYRLPAAGSRDTIEFQQTGFEWFGGGGPIEDAEACALGLESVARGGVADAVVRFGDVGVFLAVLDALSFSPRWRERLVRAFRRTRGVETLLASAGDTAGAPGEALAMGLAQAQPDVAVRMIDDVFAIAGVRTVGGRSTEEIAERLRDRLIEGAPDPAAARALLAYLSVSAPAGEASRAILRVLKAEGVRLDSVATDRFDARLAELKRLDPPMWSGAVFDATAGRRFDYYDGFVFDLARPGMPGLPIAAGGRYDGLIARLSGGALRLSAIGASVRLDRLSGAEGGR
jgi:ATP phosphoribosyltransferase regulatory subunit